jgi:hypothetical protein
MQWSVFLRPIRRDTTLNPLGYRLSSPRFNDNYCSLSAGEWRNNALNRPRSLLSTSFWAFTCLQLVDAADKIHVNRLMKGTAAKRNPADFNDNDQWLSRCWEDGTWGPEFETLTEHCYFSAFSCECYFAIVWFSNSGVNNIFHNDQSLPFWLIWGLGFYERLALLSACLLLISCLAYSSTLRIEMIRSSETSADFYRTTRQCYPENRTSS